MGWNGFECSNVVFISRQFSWTIFSKKWANKRRSGAKGITSWAHFINSDKKRVKYQYFHSIITITQEHFSHISNNSTRVVNSSQPLSLFKKSLHATLWNMKMLTIIRLWWKVRWSYDVESHFQKRLCFFLEWFHPFVRFNTPNVNLPGFNLLNIGISDTRKSWKITNKILFPISIN